MNKTTTELAALLRKLSAISPKECRYTEEGEWQILDTNTGHWLHLYDANEIDPFRVGGLLQRRIQARGWKWNIGLSTSDQATGPFWADIDAITEYTFWCYGDTPAAALLTAYIAALEALNADGCETPAP